MTRYPDVVRVEAPYRLTLRPRYGKVREPFEIDVDFERRGYWYGYRVAGTRGQEEFPKHSYEVVAVSTDPGPAPVATSMGEIASDGETAYFDWLAEHGDAEEER